MTPIAVQVWRAEALPDPVRAALAALRPQITFDFPVERYQWTAKTWLAVAHYEGQVAGQAGMVEREITVGGQPLRVGGVGSVWTAPAQRGKGLATAAVRAATAYLRTELALDYALLHCSEALVPFYARLGWQVLRHREFVHQPSGKIRWPYASMFLPLGQAPWPAGDVDLRGPVW